MTLSAGIELVLFDLRVVWTCFLKRKYLEATYLKKKKKSQYNMFSLLICWKTKKGKKKEISENIHEITNSEPPPPLSSLLRFTFDQKKKSLAIIKPNIFLVRAALVLYRSC